MLDIGKVPENVLKRSIIKQIKTKRKEILIGAGVGEDCSAISLEDGEILVTSVDPITATTFDCASLAVYAVTNDIATAGAEPLGVMLSALLPVGIEEADIKRIMQDAESACAKLNVQLMGGHTEITDAVNKCIITATGYGKVKANELIKTGGAKEGDDIVVTKYIALEGSSIIARKKEQELLSQFSKGFVDAIKDFDKSLSVVKEALIAAKCGATSMHDITEGGIFGALWEVGAASKKGLEVDLKSIPIRQETIEICEKFTVNPYELISGGSLLITTPKGHDLVRELAKEGIASAVVGKITGGNDRIVINDDEKRFLEPPKSDEIYKVN